MRDMFAGDDDLLRRYLLGELSEEEEANLEQRLLQENRLFRRAELIEGELLADYARGELTPAQRERVRSWSASPGGRARLELALRLKDIPAEPAVPTVRPFLPRIPPPAPAPVWYRSVATLAAGLLLVVGGVWTAWELQHRAPETRVDIAQASPTPPVVPPPVKTPPAKETPAPQEMPTPAPDQPSPAPGVVERATTQAFALAFTTVTRSAGDSEEGEETVLRIQKEIEEVDFQVELDAAGKGPYAVTLTSGDEEAFQAKRLKLASLDAGKRGIRFEVPVDKLPAGTYTIEVQDVSAADTMPLIQSFEIR